MAKPDELHDPWLVAVWPGMGSVALLAGTYLLQRLEAERVAELDAHGFFEIQHIDVQSGIATAGRLPRCMFFEWKDPRGRHDLLIFVGEAQPSTGGYALCQEILDYAVQRGVRRFFTFAAMATQLQPGKTPRVFAAATDAASLKAVEKLKEVETLEEGQISGLNGMLLGAGAERGLRGTCLLGELPFYAVGVPNPRAAQAVLERFTELSGIEIDFTELERQAKVVDENLEQLLEQMTQAAAQASGDEEDGEDEPDSTTQAEQSQPKAPTIDARTQHRIESLFERARHDRGKAFELKRELDRLGVFKQYEDRFLDLFRKAD